MRRQSIFKTYFQEARGRRFALVAALALAGCVPTVTPKAEAEIRDNAACGDGNLRDWEKLTGDQQKHAYWAAVRSFYDLELSCFGDPIPDAYKTDPWTKAIAVPSSASRGGK